MFWKDLHFECSIHVDLTDRFDISYSRFFLYIRLAVKSELLGATSEGNLGAADSPFVSDTLAAVTGDYQSAYAASYYSRYGPISVRSYL